MWQPNYTPVAGSLAISALVAALPIFALLFLLGIARRPAWIAGLSGLGVSIVIAAAAYRMPAGPLLGSVTNGAAFGLFPIGWIVYWAIVLYRITIETGKFEIIKDSIGSLTADHRLQGLLIAFAFGAFIEGAAGFGTPVAVAAAMLTGLGFSPFYAAGICLLANTAPVAFGSIGIPLVTLQGVTGLPMHALSSNVGRVCAPVSLFIPAYLVVVMSGWRGLTRRAAGGGRLRHRVRRLSVPRFELRGAVSHGYHRIARGDRRTDCPAAIVAAQGFVPIGRASGGDACAPFAVEHQYSPGARIYCLSSSWRRGASTV